MRFPGGEPRAEFSLPRRAIAGVATGALLDEKGEGKHHDEGRPEVGDLIPAPLPETIAVEMGRWDLHADLVVPLLTPVEMAGREGESDQPRARRAEEGTCAQGAHRREDEALKDVAEPVEMTVKEIPVDASEDGDPRLRPASEITPTSRRRLTAAPSRPSWRMGDWRFLRGGMLCVVSGPSGSGKTTLCRRFSGSDETAVYAVSATTRPPREGEVHGTDYFFLSREAFEEGIARGDFLEHAEVHGRLYGTLKSEVLGHLESGRDVLMDIDVQGANLVRASTDPAIREALVDIFILLPGDEELVTRVRSRGTESEEELALRLHNAREESRHWADYRYTLVSADRETDFATFRSILSAERCRSRRLRMVADEPTVSGE